MVVVASGCRGHIVVIIWRCGVSHGWLCITIARRGGPASSSWSHCDCVWSLWSCCGRVVVVVFVLWWSVILLILGGELP
jgi:hypothetical protein